MRFHKRTAGLIPLVLILIGTAAVLLAANLPVLWTAGGLDAGTTGAGQSATMAADAMGNVAVVSGPALNSQDLAVTSYTQDGTFRWRSTVTPNVGRFLGDWIAASPEGDFVAVGHNITSTGNPISITLVRYSSDGTLLWRRDIAGTVPSVGRLLVDAAGSAYLAFNSVGDGQDIRLQKYDASGVLQWSQVISTGTFANDVATSAGIEPERRRCRAHRQHRRRRDVDCRGLQCRHRCETLAGRVPGGSRHERCRRGRVACFCDGSEFHRRRHACAQVLAHGRCRTTAQRVRVCGDAI